MNWHLLYLLYSTLLYSTLLFSPLLSVDIDSDTILAVTASPLHKATLTDISTTNLPTCL